MGQKIHPIGLRLGIIRGWDSRWFQEKNLAEWIREDFQIRKFVLAQYRHASISRIEIERANKVHVIINTGKPGLVIGKRGSGIEDLRKKLEKLTQKPIKISVKEIKQPELDAELVAQNICEALEKRVAFRRAMKQSMSRTMKAGAKGVKVQISGRLGGAEIARTERNHQGKVPLHTLRADIDYSLHEARTPAGRIGVKVWVYRGEILPQRAETPAETL
ncbi:30S ribosomal protein S3 [bacterium]|nr:30S ribosomal protein S3 [bacterium]